MHPAELLLNMMGLAIMYVAPLLGWFMLRDGRDRSADRWFAAALVYAMGASLFVLQGLIPAHWAIEGSLLCSWITLTMFKAVLRHELGLAHGARLLAPLTTLAWALFCHLAWSVGGLFGLSLLGLAGLGLFEVYLLLLVRRLFKQMPSRGLLVLGTGLALIACANFTRVALTLWSGQPHHLLDFSPISNLLLLTIFLCVLCYSMGYWGYLFEKVHLARLAAHEAAARATERQKVANEYSSQLEQLVQQRDHMVLVNSRFSALNALAMFNSGIVHEISQPLQGVLTAAEILSLELRAASRMDLVAQAEDISRMTLKISHVLDALRRLMQSTPPQLQSVSMHELLSDCLPIIASECQQRGVMLTLDMPLAAQQGQVRVNKTLMERVVLNLASQALDALEGWTPHALQQPNLRIGVEQGTAQGQPVARVVLSDNGPGGQEASTDMFAKDSPPTDGKRVGLQFVHAIVSHWHGTLDVRSQTEGVQTGTTYTVTLPMVQG